ncbi:MAG: cupredoxin domain-containing protein [Alphaproteobacteria bacterium]|nr:cupredoxin domain-containing protein [Alphaproteobacteria bacterium]MDE2629615.1 cupredoxin domain-containing protein [Alphaproteobacteria bacterium]
MKPILLGTLFALVSTGALGADNVTSLTLKDHKFLPAEIHVKADTPTTVTLVNDDDQTEEFDSASLKIEKVVAAHSTGTMRWRPLAPGRYPFMGEFHSKTAQGTVIAE